MSTVGLREVLKSDAKRNTRFAFVVVTVFRLGHAGHESDRWFFTRWLLKLSAGVARPLVRGILLCDLPPAVRAGPGLRLAHAGKGITVHASTELGANVTLFQHCTIGVIENSDARAGAPVLEDEVYVGAGATIVGPVRVGAGAVVAANSLVTQSVPPNVTAIGVPATWNAKS